MITRKQAMRMRRAIVQSSSTLTDDVATEVPYLFDIWRPDTDYIIGDRRRHNTTLYKCIQNHTSQDDWTPDVAVSLWVRTDNPAEEWPEWVQPTGAQDVYMLNAKVSHNNKHWISIYDNNSWEPGIFGWVEQ